MRRSGASALLAILVAGVSIRLSPLLTYLYWGADIGEYHSILRDLTASGSVSTEYVGWGVTYPFFPGVFFLQGAGVALAGPAVPRGPGLLLPPPRPESPRANPRGPRRAPGVPSCSPAIPGDEGRPLRRRVRRGRDAPRILDLPRGTADSPRPPP